ncbi:gliding motility protein GldN [Pedobacter sp. AW31-3R]|uniref:type IX secretion system ring protein PorN/GldN n=1 Tax=Pedobacter sp. AW31-3R TaxID=3445781 RepID=UPI003FA0965B
MKKVLYLLILLSLGTASFAQNRKPVKKKVTTKNSTANSVAPAAVNTDTVAVVPLKKVKIKTPPKDGFYARKDVDSSVMVPFVDVREEDVFYSKRVWRELDLRDTINSVLKAENSKLIEVLMTAIANEELTVYSPKDTAQGRLLEDNDSFKIALTAEQALMSARGTSEGDPDENGKIGAPVLKRLRPDDFMKYRIKEDWIFDVKRSVFEPRIVGIAPMKMVEGNWQPVFWVYFEEARPLLSKSRLVNPSNDASVLTYDDFFVRRLFASNIVKETNPANKTIIEILNQTDPKDPRKLYESERIKKSIADYEQSLWEY